MTSDHDETHGVSRRKILECMTWAGTGVLWTIAGGVPRSTGLIGEAGAAEQPSGLTFLQISDSHVGFDKPANPNTIGTLEEAINKIKAVPVKPAFVIHTGDITHLSKLSEFDDADRIISQARLDVHYVPGEHDVIDPEQKLYRERYGRGARGAGWYSFDANGVHFIGLVNVVDLKAGGLGNLGNDQLEWLEDDLKGRSASTPIVVFAHIPLWSVYPQWGWGTDDAARALDQLKRFGSVTVLNGHIHQIMQKVEGNVTFHTAMSTAFVQPAPGTATLAGTDEGRRRQAALPARRDRRHLQARAATARDRGPAAAGLKRKCRIMTIIAREYPRRGGACRRGICGGGDPSCRVGPGRGDRAEDRGEDRQLRLRSATHRRAGRHDRHLDQRRRRPAYGRVDHQALQVERARYRGQILVHVRDAGNLRILLFPASAHDGNRRGRGGGGRQRGAMMLDRPQRLTLVASKPESKAPGNANEPMTRRGVFATPRCRISTMSTPWQDTCSATPPMRKTPCRNATCGRCAISIPIAGRQ